MLMWCDFIQLSVYLIHSILKYSDNIQLTLLSISGECHTVSDQELDSHKAWEQGQGTRARLG